MNLVILNKEFELEKFIDEFDTLIWTERYYDYGDFELELRSVKNLDDVIKIDNYLQNPEVLGSLMIIEHIEKHSSYDGVNTYTISGRDLSSILERRVVVNGAEVRDAQLQLVMDSLISANITNPAIAERKISNLIYNGLPQSVKTKLIGIDIDMVSNLGDVVKEICGYFGMGFYISAYPEEKYLSLAFYLGDDRSTLYDKRYMDSNGVIFSSNYDNLIGTSYVVDVKNYKNAAIAYLSTNVEIRKKVTLGQGGYDSNNGSSTTVVSNTKPVTVTVSSSGSVSGLERKEVGIVCEDDGNIIPSSWINETNTNSDAGKYDQAYTQYKHYARIKANQEIAKKDYKLTTVYDAELDTFNPNFVLNKDYFLGDIVLIKEKDQISKKRVTELVRSYDSNGRSIYCSFSDI